MNILVAGDICDDVYLFSDKKKENPEHSSPIYSVSKTVVKPGMAANVAENIRSMGGAPFLLHNTDSEGITKTRLYYNDQYIHRIDKDRYVPMHDPETVARQLLMHRSFVDAVIVCDYGKGFWGPETLATLKEFKVPVFVDPYGSTKPELYLGAAFITPNLKEGRALTNYERHEDIIFNLEEKTNAKTILKLGEEGAKTFEFWFKEPKVNEVDACGAGDTFIAALTLHYLDTKNLEEAIKVANKAAALTVQHVGVYSPTKEEFGLIVDNVKIV